MFFDVNHMDNRKSDKVIYLEIVSAMYRDIAECYNVTSRVQRIELGVIRDRFCKEGISFLTKTLPKFSKAVDTALGTGTRLSVQGFALDGAIPRFLGWLLLRVFDTAGYELDQPYPIAFAHFRQLTQVMYKLEMPYDQKTEESVIQSFVETDEELATYSVPPKPNFTLDIKRDRIRDDSSSLNEWIKQARNFVTRVVSAIDPYCIQPQHGPGVVSTGEDVFEKTKFSRIYPKLEQVYPFSEWMCYNLSHVAESITDEGLNTINGGEATAKVVLVPKDSRGPRLISCEPLEIQWMQQGLRAVFYSAIENHPLTKGFVNFTDQTVNRALALEASKDGQWVTLDMKDASDRGSCELVRHLFADHPKLLEALLATRSSQTKLPNGQIVSLNKFAPMGSALCFPIEALCFWALSVSALILDGRERRKAQTSVYVYGDDIIVRKQDYTVLLQWLPKVGLKFNDRKCCVARFFRESCGSDAYVGIDVTPTRLKTTWSRRRSDPKSLESYVAFYNAMYGKGNYRTAEYVRELVESTYGVIPRTNHYDIAPNGAYRSLAGAPMFVCHEPAIRINKNLRIHYRYNSRLQRIEVSCLSSQPVKRKTKHDGYAEMLRRRTVVASRSINDGGMSSPHGGEYALVRRNRLKRTWSEAL